MNISRNEAAAIRVELKLRKNNLFNCWEVYSTVHGTGVFRWYKISKEIKNWYVRHFPDITIVPPLLIGIDGNVLDGNDGTEATTWE